MPSFFCHALSTEGVSNAPTVCSPVVRTFAEVGTPAVIWKINSFANLLLALCQARSFLSSILSLSSIEGNGKHPSSVVAVRHKSVKASMDFRVKRGTKCNTAVGSLLRVLLLLLPVVQIRAREVATRGALDPYSEQPCSLRDPAMDPTYELRYGYDVVWQIPAEPKAVLFLAHGANKDSLQYFDPGPNCAQCYGMPECRTAVLEALRRGYAVIAVTGYESDAQVVSTIVSEWRTQHSLDSLPLTAWGHSAGTLLVTTLTRTLRMRASVLMCGEGQSVEEATVNRLSFPPTLFVVMPRDISSPALNITSRVYAAMAALEALGVEVEKVPCFPKPLFPLSFTERILCMSGRMSKSVYAALKSDGWIDGQGYLARNPSLEDFQSPLARAKALPFCVATGELCLIEQVSQELLSAYAMHSFTSDANDEIFAWLDSHVASSSGAGDDDFQPPILTASI